MANALIFPGKLPRACLVRPDPVAQEQPAPIWFNLTDPARLTLNPAGNVTAWQAQSGPVLRAVSYNQDGTELAGQHLRFTRGRHGGLVLDALPPLETLSLGLIYRTQGADPGTVLTVEGGADGYAFVAAEDGRITLGTKGDAPGLDQPDGTGVVLVLCSLSAAVNRIALNDEPALTGPGYLPLGPQIYIGCRGGKRSLLNKLGSFDLSDVMVWPGVDILTPDTAQAARQLWQMRRGLGI